MALSAKLEMRQGQQLVMTPQLQQAIRLLQLSNMELNDFVDAELERNPLLEREEQTAPAKEAPEAPEASGGEAADESWLDLRKPVDDHAGTLDADFGNVFQAPGTGEPDTNGAMSGMSWSSVTQRMHNNSDDDGDFESLAAAEVSLRTYLSEQLPLTLQSPAERLDRPIPDRSGRRGRIHIGQHHAPRRPPRRAARHDRRCACEDCRRSIRPEFARAPWPNAWHCSSRIRTATIR